MKQYFKSVFFVICLLVFLSCGEDDVETNLSEVEATGELTFGANSHIVNCVTSVEVFIDGESIGVIPGCVDSIGGCDLEDNLTITLTVGDYHYEVVISGDGDCSEGDSGSVTINENECTEVFVDYREIMH